MIEGTIEALRPDGIFSGWLRDAESPAPPPLQIRLRGQVLAEAAASAFRPDLLRAGHGHGHYGFTAMSGVFLPPGPADFELFLPHRGQGIRIAMTVPRLSPPRSASVEDLLAEPPAWTVPDLVPHLGCLDLGRFLTAWGSARFVDLCFRFALCRWPLAEEAVVYRRALQEEGLPPETLMRELLLSRERDDLGPSLASPWDAVYPFAPTQEVQDAA